MAKGRVEGGWDPLEGFRETRVLLHVTFDSIGSYAGRVAVRIPPGGLGLAGLWWNGLGLASWAILEQGGVGLEG